MIDHTPNHTPPMQVVASKYMNDEGELEALTNSDWAKVGSLTKTSLDELERMFLEAIVRVLMLSVHVL